MFKSLRFGHVVLISLWAMLFADSAGAQPSTPSRATIGPTSDCPYRTVFVDPSNQTFSSYVSPEAEKIRVTRSVAEMHGAIDEMLEASDVAAGEALGSLVTYGIHASWFRRTW